MLLARNTCLYNTKIFSWREIMNTRNKTDEYQATIDTETYCQIESERVNDSDKFTLIFIFNQGKQKRNYLKYR